MEQRPKTVPIVAAFLFAATAIAAVTGCSLLAPNTPLDRIWELNRQAAAGFRAMGRISGGLLLLVGAAACFAAAGLLQRKKWAWLLALSLFAVNGSGELVTLIMTGDWLRSLTGAVIAAGFIYALGRSPVRRYFEHPAEPHAAAATGSRPA